MKSSELPHSMERGGMCYKTHRLKIHHSVKGARVTVRRDIPLTANKIVMISRAPQQFPSQMLKAAICVGPDGG